MTNANPLQGVLDDVVSSMQARASGIDKMTKGLPQVDAKKLTPEEELLVYLNPASKYPGATDPATGQPIDNALAARMLLHDMGPAAYEKWVLDMEAKRSEMGAAPPTIGTEDVSNA